MSDVVVTSPADPDDFERSDDRQLSLGASSQDGLLFEQPVGDSAVPVTEQSSNASTTSAASGFDGLGLTVVYRPRRFADLVGQRHVVAVLRQAVRSGRPPQQVLFSGGSGLGKTTVARIFAAALNCERPVDGDACGECDECLDVTMPGRSHPDVIELDAASNGGKDEVNSIASRAVLAPMRSRFKVYIIDEAHGLSRPGAEAFLKLLEEPPPHVVFLLATTDPQKMLATNRGRCLQLELAEPTEDEMVGNIKTIAARQGWDLPDWAAVEVVRSTDRHLGVRGTVMSLSKLSSLLASNMASNMASNVPVTAETVASLLGSVPAQRASLLLGAIAHHRPTEALEHLGELRRFHGDSEVRAVVVNWVRQQVRESADLLNVWRLEQVAAAPAGTLWTEVLVVKLASPALAVSPDAFAALVDRAEQLGVHLEQLLEQAVATVGSRSQASLASGRVSGPDGLVDSTCDVVDDVDKERAGGTSANASVDVAVVHDVSADVSPAGSTDVHRAKSHAGGSETVPESVVRVGDIDEGSASSAEPASDRGFDFVSDAVGGHSTHQPSRGSDVQTPAGGHPASDVPFDEPEWLDVLLDGQVDDFDESALNPVVSSDREPVGHELAQSPPERRPSHEQERPAPQTSPGPTTGSRSATKPSLNSPEPGRTSPTQPVSGRAVKTPASPKSAPPKSAPPTLATAEPTPGSVDASKGLAASSPDSLQATTTSGVGTSGVGTSGVGTSGVGTAGVGTAGADTAGEDGTDPWFDNPDAYETRPAVPAALTADTVLSAVAAVSPKAADTLRRCQLRTDEGKVVVLVPPDLAERIRHSNLAQVVRSALPNIPVQFRRFT